MFKTTMADVISDAVRGLADSLLPRRSDVGATEPARGACPADEFYAKYQGMWPEAETREIFKDIPQTTLDANGITIERLRKEAYVAAFYAEQAIHFGSPVASEGREQAIQRCTSAFRSTLT